MFCSYTFRKRPHGLLQHIHHKSDKFHSKSHHDCKNNDKIPSNRTSTQKPVNLEWSLIRYVLFSTNFKVRKNQQLRPLARSPVLNFNPNYHARRIHWLWSIEQTPMKTSHVTAFQMANSASIILWSVQNTFRIGSVCTIRNLGRTCTGLVATSRYWIVE